MEWTIPGTVHTCQQAQAPQLAQQFASMFLGGGMVLSQISGITGLEPYTVQNWVKRGFLSPPVRKRYQLNQLCRIITINMLKSVLPMERICGMLTYINGNLDDEGDDIIDDSVLYFMFVRIAARADAMGSQEDPAAAIERELRDYEEPVPGAKARVEKVLQIMLIAWESARLQQKAIAMLDHLETDKIKQ